MIPKECKRLAEVDFPIAEVSKHSAREKSIRHGHPSTLHLWWARRPLASSRAMLLALLLPDPQDPSCPVDFKVKARELLGRMQRVGAADGDLRFSLLRFIGHFANWEASTDAMFLEVARGLVRAAHPVDTPLVVDPFGGGGSIPLEASRLGCDTFGSDLNPVASLIMKVVLKDAAVHSTNLINELRIAGKEMKVAVERELAGFYPSESDGGQPIAYLWARTVRCEAPNCGAEIPLLRSFWLSTKASRRRALRYRVERPAGQQPHIAFEIFRPSAEQDVPTSTVSQAKATCLACRTVLPPDRTRAQLSAQRGGADVVFDPEGRRIGGALMLAVVTLKPGEPGRHYRIPTVLDYAAVHKAQTKVAEVIDDWRRTTRSSPCPVPDEAISLNEIRRISIPIYGMQNWGDLYTARQKVALMTIASNVRLVHASRNEAAQEVAALALSKTADLGNSLAPWKPDAECPVHLLARHAIGMAWDFAESVPSCDASGSFDSAYERSVDALESICGSLIGDSQVQTADAARHPLPDEAAAVWFTDPPYYDSVPYAHLSDFFFVWLKRALPNHPLLRDPTDPSNSLTAKDGEIVVDRPHRLSTSRKDSQFYEMAMAQAFAEGRRVLREDGLGAVVFAHKTTEGWEALLNGMIRGGWTITGSWPLATEMGSRLNARDNASLATSVHLVCRRRSNDARVGDWGEVLRELPGRVGAWMERLQNEGVRGADLVFACIGPALEIFSRYRKVETPEGEEIGLPAYLEKVWEVVGRTALEHVLGTAEARARNGAAGALEEDARLTALFLWTLQDTAGMNGNAAADDGAEAEVEVTGDEDDEEAERGHKRPGFTLVFDVVRRFAQPLGIHLPEWEARIIETKKGVVRLLPVAERAQQLFGREGADAVAAKLEQDPNRPVQLALFANEGAPAAPRVLGRERSPRRRGASVSDADLETRREATTLDRVHAAMLLQAGGRANALRALLRAEQERGPDFLRLANALSALYPRGSEEKRLLDAMLLAVPR